MHGRTIANHDHSETLQKILMHMASKTPACWNQIFDRFLQKHYMCYNAHSDSGNSGDLQSVLFSAGLTGPVTISPLQSMRIASSMRDDTRLLKRPTRPSSLS